MVQYYNSSEIFFSMMVTAILGLTIYAIISYRLKHPIYKFLFVVSIIGIVFNALWIISIFFHSENLDRVVILFARILLPLLWSFGGLGLTVYGIVAILTRKTFIDLDWLGTFVPVEGVKAIFFGILWALTGLMMILMGLITIGFMLCENYPWICPIVNSITHAFGGLGNVLVPPQFY